MRFHSEHAFELPTDPTALFNELTAATSSFPEVSSHIAARLNNVLTETDSIKWIELVEICGQLRANTVNYEESQTDESLLWLTHIEPLRKKMFLEAVPHTNMATPSDRYKWLSAVPVLQEIRFVEEEITSGLRFVNSIKDFQYAEQRLDRQGHVFNQYRYLESLLTQYSEITGETWEWS